MRKESLEIRLGQAIKKARWQKMMKQKDLANELGVSSSFICEIEKGKKLPSLQMLEQLEDELGPLWSVKA